MKRTLYIHIGVQRTATTSTQSFLRRNHAVLQEQGFLQFNGVGRHDRLMGGLFRKEITPAEVVRRLTAQADAAPHPIDRIMLSDEDICANDNIALLARLRDVFDVKIIISLRRQDLWIESWYSQNIKWQWIPLLSHLRFDEFLAEREIFDWVHYDQFLARIEPLFGQENILPIVFEKQQMPAGPLAAFCQTAAITDTGQFAHSEHKINASPSSLMGEFMRNLPLDELDEPDRLRVEKACLKADWWVKRKYTPQSALMMDLETRTDMLAEYAEGNRAVAQRYFGRDDLFQEPLPAADAPLALVDLPDDSARMMEDFVAPVLRALLPPKAKDAAKKPKN